MRIREVLVRWYKSFNYDYELKYSPTSKKQEWQNTADGWLPHVRVNLESDITAVVGANESGKSHLLDVIHIVLSGENHSRRDFCRYSTLFSVEKDKRLYPEVGAIFDLSNNERDQLGLLQIPLRKNGDLLLLRPKKGVLQVLNADQKRVALNEPQARALQALLPEAHKLETQVDLPDSVSLAALAGSETLKVDRQHRMRLLGFLSQLKGADDLKEKVVDVISILNAAPTSTSEKSQDTLDRQQELGQDLLLKIARIDQSAFIDLLDAIEKEREGLVNALIQQMNDSIARHLNVSRWWSQDQDFALRVSPREHELVFTIRDRTGTDYSFSERSRGLTYFLSYFVQLWSHERPSVPEVLLMDEPDAYLSAIGQQDLLRVLEYYAHPDDTNRADQVVYVTHSPFLINRNSGHRVRVVDKGTGDEGTRRVADVTQNHYEPLRTSLGAFVAETAFIGGDNLFVEGISDQVLLSGISSRLRREGAAPSATLDLNKVTLVPGGANMPYMLYLARGRDQFKPACAVLLDSDGAGREARRQILRGGAKGRPSVSAELIVMVGEAVPDAVIEPNVVVEEPEDLVPMAIAGVAARNYARHLLGLSAEEAAKFEDKTVLGLVSTKEPSLWNAIEATFRAAFDTEIGKAGFAKEIISYLEEHSDDDPQLPEIQTLKANFAALIAKISATLAKAREAEVTRKRDMRVEQLIEEFFETHPDGCIRDDALVVLGRIHAAADDTEDGDVIRAGLANIKREHKLSEEPLVRVGDYPHFRAELERLPLLPRLANQNRTNLDDIANSGNQKDNLAPEGTPAPIVQAAAVDELSSPEASPPQVGKASEDQSADAADIPDE